MKIEIEVNEEELKELVVKIIADNIANKILNQNALLGILTRSKLEGGTITDAIIEQVWKDKGAK